MEQEQIFKKLFSRFSPAEPSAELFDRIIFSIRREKELRRRRNLIFSFSFLVIVSLIATPLSWMMLVNQAESSGVSYFLSAALSDFGAYLTLWQDFSLAILESLPIAGIMIFLLSLALSVFTLRLFLNRKRLLLKYFMHGMNFNN